MKKLLTFLLRTLKGIYDILATYLLLFLIPFCLASVGIWLLTGQVATYLEFESRDTMWALASHKLRVPDAWIRLAAMLPMHLAIWWLLRRPIEVVQPISERAFDKMVLAFRWLTSRAIWLRTASEVLFTIVVTLVLAPFVIQPTLVPGFGPSAWVERAANFADGTASAELADSVVGLYRTLFADPIVAPAVPRQAVDDAVNAELMDPKVPPAPSGNDPLMDRWDSYLIRISEGELDRFATLKAFMWVESAGRQYAVSSTGCSGLMQFCAGTARNAPFGEIFGTGQVYVCACADGKCRIPRETQADLESGDPAALERHRRDFPCRLTDARFDPEKTLRAGDRYIERLSTAFGGNIYLMYIGYNSGPMIAQSVWAKVGRNPDASLEEIELHLADAMRGTYGSAAESRARSLTRTHLPKLRRARDRYIQDGLPPAKILYATSADVL